LLQMLVEEILVSFQHFIILKRWAAVAGFFFGYEGHFDSGFFQSFRQLLTLGDGNRLVRVAVYDQERRGVFCYVRCRAWQVAGPGLASWRSLAAIRAGPKRSITA